jgi:dihydroorotate dehydrogenase (NAD+) catalytic subunit
MAVDLSIAIGGLKLKNPVMVASGTFGFGSEYAEYTDLSKLGGVVVKATTLEPRPGNPGIRLWETPAGLLNSIGLANPGADAVIAHELPRAASYGTAIVVNIAGNTIEDYAKLAGKLDAVGDVDALEVNISCPNVKCGGMAFGSRPDLAAEVTRAVRAATSLPLIIKLSPNAADLPAVASAVEEVGADAVSLINTLLGMAIDIRKRRPVFENTFAGLSGPCVKPVALRMVWQVAEAVNIPVIGMGGISSAEDALEFILAGAWAIQIGTANFVDPRTAGRVLHGLEEFCRSEGIKELASLRGAAHV